MDLLIFIILIAIVISKMSRKNKKKPSTVKEVNRHTDNLRKQQEKQRQQFEMMQAQARQKQQQIRQSNAKQQGKVTQRQAAAKQQTASQQELKKRLEEKYRKTQPSQSDNSILSRAVEHVQEDAADELKLQDDMLHKAAGGGKTAKASGEKDMDENALMNRVYDLMVTGYSGNMEFDRDFLAEATDMLNRIQN